MAIAPLQCMLCRSVECDTVLVRGRWRYLQCRSCGLVRLDPRPGEQELKNFYGNYLPDDCTAIEQWGAMMRPVVRRSADLIETRCSTYRGRLLDVGCGYGFFLQEMRARGWHVEGTEISETGRQYMKDAFRIKAYAEPLEALTLAGNSYDVVTFFYVLEHVADPEAVLLAAHRALKPGGLVVVRWPHTTPIVKLLGPFADRLDLYHTPYHLYDFSPATMMRLLSRCGFADSTTVPGGYTLPPGVPARMAAAFFGRLGEFLCAVSGGRLLLPGLSKTTVAVKRTDR